MSPSTHPTPPRSSENVTCHGARSLMEAFVDGELSPEQTLELEGHMDACVQCQANAEFLRVLSSTIEEVVLWEKASALPSSPGALTTSTPLPIVDASSSPFMARLEQAVQAEIEREASETSARGVWFAKVAALTAAASATWWLGVRTLGADLSALRQATSQPEQSQGSVNLARATVGDDDVLTLEGALDRLIDFHSAPPQPQVTSADLLPELEPDVGVRMQLPKLDAFGARWEGASLVPVRSNQRAASFRYQLPKGRVTLYVFNASRLRVQDSKLLTRDQPTPQPVYLGQWRGYNVAAKENRGVGYALATDMDGPAVARMIHDVH
jgi:anti-sigma factor RsiW